MKLGGGAANPVYIGVKVSTKTISSPSTLSPPKHINVLGQLLKYILQGIVEAAARDHGVDTQARS
jgi:hypothetical protein